MKRKDHPSFLSRKRCIACSAIRGAMLRILLSRSPKQARVDGYGAAAGVSPDASVCAFWCSVALGGLLQGRTVQAVRSRRHAFRALSMTVLARLHFSLFGMMRIPFVLKGDSLRRIGPGIMQ